MLLVGPDLTAWMPATPKVRNPKPSPAESSRYPVHALAKEHDATVYQHADIRYGRGVLRSGMHTRARSLGPNGQCPGGVWYELMLGGYVCTTRGFEVVQAAPRLPKGATRPRTGRALPYRYAKAPSGALRFTRLPNERERERAVDSDNPGALDGVLDRMKGVSFVAVAGFEEAPDGVEYARTLRGHYLEAETLKHAALPQMHGEPVVAEQPLPMAFVFGDGPAPLSWLDGKTLHDAGVAHKHARLSIQRKRVVDGRAYWLTSDGLAVPAERVRVARQITPPQGVQAGERWIHVDLSEQTLVAYRGAKPVYATLVSSGKPGYDTPIGEFRIRHKYISTTMQGDDPVEGRYYIEEVPWTQYYSGSYALHGAFWHSDFGRVRSHGCTNLAPADARWLYYFTKPDVPPHWHGVRELGTRLLVTS